MESIGFDVLTHPHTQKPPRNIKANDFDDSGAPPWLERAQAPRCSHRIRNQSLAQPTATRRQHGFGSHTSSGCTSTYQPPSQKHAASKLLLAISFQRSKAHPISPKHYIHTRIHDFAWCHANYFPVKSRQLLIGAHDSGVLFFNLGSWGL
jgi:hypothetical protein